MTLQAHYAEGRLSFIQDRRKHPTYSEIDIVRYLLAMFKIRFNIKKRKYWFVIVPITNQYFRIYRQPKRNASRIRHKVGNESGES